MAARKLESYRRKRDFGLTPEPEGLAEGDGGNRFVVHKHWATADHYDLRLQVGDVLKSWAVPKGPSLNPDDKRFAVETEDHPLEYIDFEGVIPAGEYGGGPMIVWDTGTWAPMDDIASSLARGAFKFRLAGQKLKGGWMLARLKKGEGETRQGWLLIKEHDLAADRDTDILAARPESVKSGRNIEQLLPEPEPAASAPPSRPARLRPGALKGSFVAPMPEHVSPQLATASKSPSDGKGWLHEIKFDGYRTIARVSGGAARMTTRAGLDWTHRFGDLPQAFAALACREAVIDGEIVVLDEKGVSHFAALQDALAKGPGNRLVFYAFDLIYLDGWDLTDVPLEKRKGLLQQLLAGHTGARSPIQYSDHVAGEGGALYERASEMGLEGVVSKLAASPYRSGRSTSWTKTKALKAGDFVIAGYTTSDAAGGLAALALGEWNGGELHYRGKVGTGFDAATLKTLHARLEPLREGAVSLPDAPREIHWVRPVLAAHVHYTNRTTDNALRHPVFKGLREASLSTPVTSERRRLISDADLASIWVTNPTRRLFGRSGATKLDIAVYYAAVGDYMLPHLFDRPVSLVRCPTGKPEDCFFQRHAFKGMPPSVVSFAIKNSEEEDKTYLTIVDARGYLALAQFGVVEFHTWGTERGHLEKPDRIVFDLDPGEGVPWREVTEAAVHVRDALEAMGLVPYVKTSGGKGIHIVVPIRPRLGWKQVHKATGAVVDEIVRSAPKTFTAVMGAANRKGLIFIDFHRNARSATAAAPYSLRARPNLPASTPLDWRDLESIDAPEDLNYSTLPALLARSGDPWADINESAQELPVRLTGSK